MLAGPWGVEHTILGHYLRRLCCPTEVRGYDCIKLERMAKSLCRLHDLPLALGRQVRVELPLEASRCIPERLAMPEKHKRRGPLFAGSVVPPV